MSLLLTVLADSYAVCQLPADHGVPDWAHKGEFFSYTVTPDEVSIVSVQHAVPEGVLAELSWRALKIEGILEFGKIGVIADISRILAGAEISIFVISTYNTDYILLKDHKLDTAIGALVDAGYTVQ